MTNATDELPDPAEIRRLRAAVEEMRSRQGLAKAGSVVVGICFVIVNNAALRDTPALTIYLALAPVLLIGGMVPFFRAKCPKCRGRYQSFGGLFRAADNPAPCANCGFDINAHIPRYGRA